MRILIQTVGTGRPPGNEGDPGNPVWEALAFAATHSRAEHLVHLCSEQTARDTLPRVNGALAEGGWKGESESSVSADVEDAGGLALEYARIIDRLREEHPGARIEADFTSGTKAMSAALVFAAVARRVPTLHYATGPRDEGGRVTKTKGLASINTAPLVADRLLDELGRLFDRGQFVAVREQATALLEQGIDDERLHARARSLASLSEVYDCWDRFDWRSAAACLRVCKRREEFATAGWDATLLDCQNTHLAHARSHPEGKPPPAERLVDLYANAQRCIDRGRHDDATARLYRLVEYIGQGRLCSHGIPRTSRASLKSIERIAPEWARCSAHRARSGKVDLGLRDNIRVLAEAGDPVGLWLAERYDPPDPASPKQPGPLKAALDARNNSLLAHGTTPVRSEQAKELAVTVAALLELHLDQNEPGCGPARFGTMLSTATFAGCPWVQHGQVAPL